MSSETKATFYFHINNIPDGCPDVQTFNDGNFYGPCNGGKGVQYGSQSKYWVAIANADKYCGETITVQYRGNSIDLVIQDSCPGCELTNGVDMSLDALIELTGSKEAACAINTIQPIVTWAFKNNLIEGEIIQTQTEEERSEEIPILTQTETEEECSEETHTETHTETQTKQECSEEIPTITPTFTPTFISTFTYIKFQTPISLPSETFYKNSFNFERQLMNLLRFNLLSALIC